MRKIMFLVSRAKYFIAQHNDEILWCLDNLSDMYDLVLYIINALCG